MEAIFSINSKHRLVSLESNSNKLLLLKNGFKLETNHLSAKCAYNKSIIIYKPNKDSLVIYLENHQPFIRYDSLYLTLDSLKFERLNSAIKQPKSPIGTIETTFHNWGNDTFSLKFIDSKVVNMTFKAITGEYAIIQIIFLRIDII